MTTEQYHWTRQAGWQPALPEPSESINLVLSFGSPAALIESTALPELRAAFPGARHCGCSTAGEIHGTRVNDDSLVATAIAFTTTSIDVACVPVESAERSHDAGRMLASAIPSEGLRHAFVLCDGLSVNGSEFVEGLQSVLPAHVTITGGMAGDGTRFKETYVVWNGEPRAHLACVIGFYGPDLNIGFGSLGGWDPFGPERKVTRSSGNVLYELDGRSALTIYKAYLGEHAAGLPATGLLFPLSLRTTQGESGVVRTILAVDEAAQTMTFAGDVPQGAYARLMKANFDRLIDGALGAARQSRLVGAIQPQLAILVSCVGRKLVLGQRIEEEVEGVRDVVGEDVALAGFYSYGEISPFTPSAKCELHNQTMTITTLAEAPRP